MYVLKLYYTEENIRYKVICINTEEVVFENNNKVENNNYVEEVVNIYNLLKNEYELSDLSVLHLVLYGGEFFSDLKKADLIINNVKKKIQSEFNVNISIESMCVNKLYKQIFYNF